ncbi:MAG: hypothetical protein PUC44_03100 [Eubacteriales bacterium]|nr:hypothetical protein [Eubacteriales bacterium]
MLTVFKTNAEFGMLQSLQMTGAAFVLDDPEDPAYRIEAEIRKIQLEALQKLDDPMYLIRIQPGEITVLNSELRKRGYRSRQTVSVSGKVLCLLVFAYVFYYICCSSPLLNACKEEYDGLCIQ